MPWSMRGRRHCKASGAERTAAVKTFQREVQLRTAGGLTVTDITDEVRDAVRESGIQDGICCVYSPHTTCSVRVNEWERGFLEDFAVMLKRLVPTEHYYAHDDWDQRTENINEEDQEFGNAHSTACRCCSAGRRVGARARRRTVPRHLAARPLPRARPRARPPLAVRSSASDYRRARGFPPWPPRSLLSPTPPGVTAGRGRRGL